MTKEPLTICGKVDCEGCLNQHRADMSYCEKERNKMTKLKPCPVCGFQGVKYDNGEDDPCFCHSIGYSNDGLYIFCSVCGCRSMFLSATEEAIKVWNNLYDVKDTFKEEEQR